MKKIKKKRIPLYSWFSGAKILQKDPSFANCNVFFFFSFQGVVGQILGESGMTGSTMTLSKECKVKLSCKTGSYPTRYRLNMLVLKILGVHFHTS